MAQIVRYRTGIDEMTGKLLRGHAHLQQSLGNIWRTRTNLRVMLLDYGSNLRGFLSEDITQTVVLSLYDELVSTAHRWEKEARIQTIQLVSLTQQGGLGLRYGGFYYPEGRFDNYTIVEQLGAIAPFGAQRLGRNAA